MESLKQLKNLIQEMNEGEMKDEILESIDNVIDEVSYLEKEKDLLQDELNDTPDLTSINLGLDTIHYYLEKGNLKISQQLESAFTLINP